MSYVFKGPTTQFQYPTGSRLFDRMKQDRGICVYTLDGGITWKQELFPYMGTLQPGADAAAGTVTALQEGVDIFYGGHTYFIGQTLHDQLVAAGLGAYILGDIYLDLYEDTY